MSAGLLNERARDCVALYDAGFVHYNLIADGVYRARKKVGGPLQPEFERFIVAGLLGFDMGRTMGREDRYSLNMGFARRLHDCLVRLRSDLQELLEGGTLPAANLPGLRRAIGRIYDSLSARGTLSTKSFHVGATKILHWLFPDLCIMLDQNVARAFSASGLIDFKGTTQPGYCSQKYFECIQMAQEEVRCFGLARFVSLDEAETPIARIFDKVAFVTGLQTSRQRAWPSA